MRPKKCFIKGCGNVESSGKVFVTVPSRNQMERRRQWLAVAGISQEAKNVFFCCVDHFNLEEDAVNWQYFKHAGSALKLKPDVVPHTSLQTPRKRMPHKSQVSSSSKKRKLKFLEKLYEPSAEEPPSTLADHYVNPPSQHPIGKLQNSQMEEPSVVFSSSAPSDHTQGSQTESGGLQTKGSSAVISAPSTSAPAKVSVNDSMQTSGTRGSSARRRKQTFPKSPEEKGVFLQGGESPLAWKLPHDPDLMVSASTSTLPPSTPPHPLESPRTTPPTSLRTPSPQPARRVMPQDIDRQCARESPRATPPTSLRTPSPQPARRVVPQDIGRQCARDDSSSDISEASTSTWGPPSFEGNDSSSGSSPSKAGAHLWELKKKSAVRETQLARLDPRHYLGLPPQHFGLVSSLAITAKVPERNIMLVLKKIRTNDEYWRLANDFGISTSQISSVFRTVLPHIRRLLAHFIHWPSKESIMATMPMQFRARFMKVQSIIDGFEIEIEKPSKPTDQAMTWSDYKKCNTVKYLISCTPLGLINFISPGFGGRTSDNKMVELSGFLQVLPNNCSVLADRGFKQIERLLGPKSVTLMRPASVAKDQKLTASEVKMSKMISSTRIHIERVISRVREFSFLGPHSCVHHSLVPLLDHAVVVACALINLQDPIILV